MAFCTNCGNQIPDGSRFCGNCGSQQGAPAPVASAAPAYNQGNQAYGQQISGYNQANAGQASGYAPAGGRNQPQPQALAPGQMQKNGH